MQFVSTRKNKEPISFSQAISRCICPDGGYYVPAYSENLRQWIYYLNDKTSFSSIAGSLTTALMKEEFSPIICETIATKAFNFSPEFRQIDDSLYKLSLYTGPTGSHKDFGVSFLLAYLEYTLLLKRERATVVAISDGEIGSCLAHAMRGKNQLTALILYSKGTLRGFKEEDCVWNGGNIYPVEVNGSMEDCSHMVRELFSRQDIVEKYNLTLANTFNIGRLLPQTFFYTYAFSRLKDKVFGDIFYALAPGNYSNLVAGLYAWKFSLPVNGFITECTPALTVDTGGKAQILDSLIPLEQRQPADPGNPSNLERLEEIFNTHPAMLRGLVFPVPVSEEERTAACKELFMKYGILANKETSGSYAAAKKRTESFSSPDNTVVLVSRDHPAYSRDEIRHVCGEAPSVPDFLQELLIPITPQKTMDCTVDAVLSILQELE